MMDSINIPALNEIFVKPRFCEIDSLLIVHHSRFIPWVEEANFNFVEKVLKISRRELFDLEMYNPIQKLDFTYRNNVRWEDELVIRSVMEYSKFATFTMHNQVLCRHQPGKVFAEAKVKLLITDKELKIKLLVPEFYYTKIQEAEKLNPQYFRRTSHV